MKKYYIRFGEIPENEISGIYRSGERVGDEKGVSVYDAINIDGDWRIVLPSKLIPAIGFDLYNCINSVYEIEYEVQRTIKIYLVTGDEVGFGSTNEPVIKNVKIVQEL